MERACLANAGAFATKGLSRVYMPGAILLRASAAYTTISDSDLRGIEAGVVHNASWKEYENLGAWSLHHDVPPEKLARLRANFENAKILGRAPTGSGLRRRKPTGFVVHCFQAGRNKLRACRPARSYVRRFRLGWHDLVWGEYLARGLQQDEEFDLPADSVRLRPGRCRVLRFVRADTANGNDEAGRKSWWHPTM